MGGNTWAGGTGGRDTAGLGGKGGPYRLDAGHPVYQVSDWEKENVPEEVCTCTVYYYTFSCGQPQKVTNSRLIYILMFFFVCFELCIICQLSDLQQTYNRCYFIN